ncbi:MAG: M23 family metallopeptidase [Gemmatimonadaceae bacterium]|nr:M23 family metallopeptidase [Gemmatimonadaceae bacterium]
MKAATARLLTYSIVGGLAFVAMRATPPLPSSPSLKAPASVASLFDFVHETANEIAPEVTVAPLVVVANGKDKIDTLIVAGVIHSNLFNAIDKAAGQALPRGARNGLAFSLADIFEYRVDMSRDLQDGDSFHVLVERVEKPTGAVMVSKVLAARLALSGSEYDAIHFKSNSTSGEYFDSNGRSLRAAFLRAPVAFRRISSFFGMRFHPVLGRWRNHAGTDYAASSGTPVRSIGDGIVIFAGRKGGYGNVVDVKHRNGFVSRYGHLRGFAQGIRRGTRIEIGKTIGFVGMTGLATGPHLHFEVLVGGRQRDPRVALRMRGGEPISSREQPTFQRLRDNTLASLLAYKSAGTN